MSLARHHADVLVVGHTLETALTATLLARRGASVLWLGRPGAGESGDGFATPSVLPPLVTLPCLESALDEVGILAEVRRLWTPVGLQILSPTLRLTLPEEAGTDRAVEEALGALRATQEDAVPLPPIRTGWFGKSRRPEEARAREERLPSFGGPVERAWVALQSVLGSGRSTRVEAARAAGAPHLVDGGIDRLVGMLYQRFVELGGRVLPTALDGRLSSLEMGWSGGTTRSSTGEEAGARVVLLGLDEQQREALLPEGSAVGRKLAKRVPPGSETPLRGMPFRIRARGLPAPLGRLAVIDAPVPMLLERRRGEGGVDDCTVFWRSRGGDPQREAEDVLDGLRPVLPFFEGHLVKREAPRSVPGLGQVEVDLPMTPMRRLLLGLSGVAGTGGLDDAAALAEALADRASKLAPRKKVAA